MNRRSALIIGHTGQDGQYLSEFLLRQGSLVTGVASHSIIDPLNKIKPPMDIRSPADVDRLISFAAPDEIYFLAAWHHSSEDVQPGARETFQNSQAIHCDAFLNVLDSVLRLRPHARVFYAASCHIFGEINYTPQDERHPIRPANIYGYTKAYGMEIARYYREQHGVYCCSGILYNHESPRRAAKFLSRKIANGVSEIVKGREAPLKIGNPCAIVDWGHAADYVKAMKAGLSLDMPRDYIIASGVPHTVRQFAEIAFASCELDAEDWLVGDIEFQGKPEPELPRIGDSSLLRELSGWAPEYAFEDMVKEIVRNAIADST